MTRRQDLLQLFVGLIAIASFFMGLAGYFEYLRLGTVAGHAVFIAPYLCALAVACGVVMFFARIRPRLALISNLVIIPAVIAARIWGPQLSSAWISGRPFAAGLLTLLILVGAGASLVLVRTSQPQRYRAPVPEILVSMLCIAATTYVSVALIEQNILRRQQYSQSAAQSIAHAVRDGTIRAERLLVRLGERWSSFNDVPAWTYTQSEFNRYLRDLPFLLSMAVVDADSNVVVELVQPATRRRTSLTGLTDKVTTMAQLKNQIELALENGAPRITVHEPDWSDHDIALAVSPIFNAEMNDWSIIVLIDLPGMISWAMPPGDARGHFAITRDNRMLYETGDARSGTAVAAGDIAIPFFDDQVLNLSYHYTIADTDLRSEILAEFVWLAGIILTFLLIASVRLTLITRHHAAQLVFNAFHDPLTGVPNRRMLEEMLRRACTRARRENQSIAVVFLDLDGIRLINDSVGHEIGDAVLIEAARRLECMNIPDSKTAQLGPVEFVLLIGAADIEGVQACTQQVINSLSTPYEVAGHRLMMVVSAGIAISDGYLDDPMQLVRQADLAMVRAKRQGVNNWSVYTHDLSIRIADRLELRHELELALETNSLQLHYQPIVQGTTGQVIGMEALLRWPHPEKGMIPPSRFVPLAEDTGQILALTDWTLTQACTDCRTLLDQGLAPLAVNVNISALYFQRADFIDDINRILQASGLPPRLLVLEITESVFLQTEEAAIVKLTALRDMGIRVAIDDFGTGYSNLSYLKNLPVDKLKIDRTFIVDIVNSTADAAIVQGIISMAHHLDLQVVAEGVETDHHLAFLMRNGCDTFQGFLFARPTPFEEMLDALRQNDFHLHRPAPRGDGHSVSPGMAAQPARPLNGGDPSA